MINYYNLDYITINKGLANEMKLAIGGYDKDNKYTPLNRDELESYLMQKVWSDEPDERYSHDMHKLIPLNINTPKYGT